MIGGPAEQDPESDPARQGLQTRATSPTLESVSGNGRSGLGDIRTFTVVAESTESGLLVLLSYSW